MPGLGMMGNPCGIMVLGFWDKYGIKMVYRFGAGVLGKVLGYQG